jgi:hypothetical protein
MFQLAWEQRPTRQEGQQLKPMPNQRRRRWMTICTAEWSYLSSGAGSSGVFPYDRRMSAVQVLFYRAKTLHNLGKLFLVQATTDELNACEAFREYLPEIQTLSVELCRQKIKEFQAITVGTPDTSIDRCMFN